MASCPPPEPPVAHRRDLQALSSAYYADRTLRAIELLAFQDLSCPQLAATLQIHVRTARRLLLRLAADGYIEQTFDDRRRYRATLRLAALGAQVVAHAQLPRIAAPFVADLHAQTGATAHLIIPSYQSVACVVHCDAHHGHGPPEPMVRELVPAHATAAGKVLLAHRPPWRHSVLAGPLERHTDRTVTSPAELELEAAEIRTRGYAIDDREYHPRMTAIAAPVRVADDVAAAVAITTTPDDPAGNGDAFIRHVTQTAAAISRALQPLDHGTPVRTRP